MKITVHANDAEMNAYQGYMEALAGDNKDYSPIMELMLESFVEARKHPEHVESESDGFVTYEVQTTETGGCDFRVNYDSETIVKFMEIMTEHRDTVEKVVRWLHGGLEIFKGISGMFSEMKKAVITAQAKYRAEQQTYEAFRTGSDS
jgi:hypothetical protein